MLDYNDINQSGICVSTKRAELMCRKRRLCVAR